MIQTFKEHNPAWEQVKVALTNKDIVERKTLTSEMPAISLLICLFHVLRTFKREITTKKMDITAAERTAVLEILQKLANSRSQPWQRWHAMSGRKHEYQLPGKIFRRWWIVVCAASLQEERRSAWLEMRRVHRRPDVARFHMLWCLPSLVSFTLSGNKNSAKSPEMVLSALQMKITWTCVLAFNILIINRHCIFYEHYVPYLYANKHCIWMMNIMYLQNNKNTFLYWMMNIVWRTWMQINIVY